MYFPAWVAYGQRRYRLETTASELDFSPSPGGCARDRVTNSTSWLLTNVVSPLDFSNCNTLGLRKVRARTETGAPACQSAFRGVDSFTVSVGKISWIFAGGVRSILTNLLV